MNRKTLPTVLAALLILTACFGCGYQARKVQIAHQVKMSGVTIDFAPGTGGPETELKSGSDGYVLKSGSLTIRINNMNLSVNGRSYGSVKPGDHLFIDKETIKVNGETRAPESE